MEQDQGPFPFFLSVYIPYQDTPPFGCFIFSRFLVHRLPICTLHMKFPPLIFPPFPGFGSGFGCYWKKGADSVCLFACLRKLMNEK